MKILHITDAFAPETGGVERVLLNLTARQAKSGHQVVVLTKGLPGQAESQMLGEVEIFRYPHFQSPTPLNWASSYIGSMAAFRQLLSEFSPDIVHAHLTLSAQGPLSILGKGGPALVASFYGPWHLEYLAEAEPLFQSRSRLYCRYLQGQMHLQKKLQARLLRQAQRVVVLSDFSIGHVRDIAGIVTDRVRKIPGGIEADRFFPGPVDGDVRQAMGAKEGDFLIFTLRRLVRRMGVDLLIRALVELGDDSGIRLAVGGAGPEGGALEALAGEMGIGDRVRFLGFVREEDLPQYYRSADLFLLPTRAEENFGLPILESAACATPVVGTAVGSIPEVLGQLGEDLLIDPSEPGAMSGKIRWAMSTIFALKARFADRAKIIRREYGWERIADRMDALYREVVR